MKSTRINGAAGPATPTGPRTSSHWPQSASPTKRAVGSASIVSKSTQARDQNASLPTCMHGAQCCMAWQASSTAQPSRTTAESAPSNAENEPRNPAGTAAVIASSASARDTLPLRLTDRARGSTSLLARSGAPPRSNRLGACQCAQALECPAQVVGRVPSPQPSRSSSPSKPIRLATANNVSPSKRLATGTLSPNRCVQCPAQIQPTCVQPCS
jgi:hypothetical protein